MMTVEQLRQLEQAASGRHGPCAWCNGEGPWPRPWAVTVDNKGDGHWDNEFHVGAEDGEGYHLATFEFRPHAELFAALPDVLPALLDVVEAAERALSPPDVELVEAMARTDALADALDRLKDPR